MDDSTNRPSQNPDGRASLTAMARATQRSSTSQATPPDSPPSSRRQNVPDSPFISDPTERTREALPPPYEDASGFIDLDKLRAAAAAEAAARPPSFAPPPPAPRGPRTPPPVAASIFAPAHQPVQSGPSQTMGMVIGGSIAAAGLIAAFFIVSRSNAPQETQAEKSAPKTVAAMNTQAVPAATPKIVPAPIVSSEAGTKPRTASA